MITRFLHLGLCSVLLLAAELRATTTTVSSTAALVSTVSSASPGDTVLLADGVYSAMFTLTANGTSGNLITIAAQNPGKAIFTGKTSIFLTGSYLKFSGFYFDNCQHDSTDTYREVVKVKTATNCVISNNYFMRCADLDSPGYAVLKFYVGSSYNTLSHNTFDGSLSISVGVSNTDTDYTNTNNTLTRNYFKNILPVGTVHPGQTNGMECMQIGSARSYTNVYTTVTENLFENVVADGEEMISNKTSSNVYLRNTFRDSASMLTLRMGDNCRAEGNFFFNTRGGIRVYGVGHLVANNYIEAPNTTNDGLYCPSGDATHVPASGVVFLNNTVVNPLYFGVRLSSSGATLNPGSLQFKNNLVISNQGPAFKDYIGGLASYTTNIASVSGTGTVGITDPGIQSLSVTLTTVGSLKRPAAGSAVVAAGTADSSITVDIDGQLRGVAFDVGADEIDGMAGVPITYRPLVAGDVGAAF